ncbi:T9SS type A sorting domain-containing protein [Flavobacteriaceae bacterium TP-CH-4]|uniref:T9SS type A sorting domain-containing protein n=1 Tax=Pelagihabitans pacificus TaxID=2696054 RepID=A0A967AVW6_9FLAO|nr:M4 family metallopeptidase [Pelagihabitans pacificus]NHF58557.1 T9SS type A sorting domain-containing protein [Pelagihabitans pacificus]
MKRTLLFLLLLSFLLPVVGVLAQNTFDDKRHKKGIVSKTVNPKKFNYPKTGAEKRQRYVSTGRTNFQMPSVFQVDQTPARYMHRVLQRSGNGLPLFIQSVPSAETARSVARQSVEVIAKEYMADVGRLLQVEDAAGEFVLAAQKTDALGQTHIKMQQVFQGIKVYGGEMVLHLDKGKQVRSLNGRNRPTPVLTTTKPKLSEANALDLVEKDLGVPLPRVSADIDSSMMSRPVHEQELLIYQMDGKDVLVRHLTVYPNIMDRWEYFVDAQSGKIIDKYYHTCAFHAYPLEYSEPTMEEASPPETGSGTDLNGITRQLNTYSVNGTNFMVNTSKPMFNAAQSQMPDRPVGGIMTLDLRNEPALEGVQIFHVTSTSNTWNNPTAVSAHYNADVSYEYFRNTFGRNSINGQGGTIISFINVADPNDGGPLENAYWNGRAMFYGNGRVAFEPFAGALDVGGHEMSHGVIQNTANLEYRYQSGAINESFADIFGVMIDRDDWLLAEDIANTQYFPSGAMRDMQNPNNGRTQLGEPGWQPKDMTEYYTGDRDNGGVHINSGIPNRAYYLVATDIGKDKAEQIYYRALETYLTVSSQFIDLRLAVIQSATDLHGANSLEVQAIRNAFDTVGITDGAPTDTDNDVPAAEGDDFILSLDIRDTDPNTLYISDTQATEYFPLTTTRVYRKPSVADDGSLAIYVTEDHTINAVTLDRNNPEETVISEEPIWAAVALSKDATKFAAVPNDESNVVYILDLVGGDFREFELYNPTSADGIATGEVLYPDALEWDYSGQYLIYDALNRLENPTGQDIQYWDVGAMKVWDNATNTFGDGTIQKIFSDLPEGVSIGNPSFSKTSGNILAFDYLDELNDEYAVIAANIETGEIKTVFSNNKLGFPNYSKNDDKMIFDTFNGGDEDIAVINIAADKISPSGNASELIPNGKWGIWYTVGTRSTLSNEKEITDFRFNVTAPPAVGVISGTEITIDLPNNINPANLVATFAHSARSQVSIGGVSQQSGVTINDFTNPVVYTVTAEDGSSKNFTVRLGNSAPNDPNDEDGDGVPNTADQCPNTPAGSVVDVTGCGIFSLPSDNFRVLAKGESCMAGNNGSIHIDAAQNLNYTASLEGNGLDLSFNFNTGILFENLEGGTYNVCITVQGQAGYENCFEVVVDEPEALSVASKVNLDSKEVTLDLSGGETYTIALNDEIVVTKESSITLPLSASATKLTVKTDKECQGTHEETLTLSDKPIIYPNPVRSGTITLVMDVPSDGSTRLQLHTLSGQLVMQKMAVPNTKVIEIDVDQLASGTYLLSAQMNSETFTYKIIKQ